MYCIARRLAVRSNLLYPMKIERILGYVYGIERSGGIRHTNRDAGYMQSGSDRSDILVSRVSLSVFRSVGPRNGTRVAWWPLLLVRSHQL
jgi:hypothetical protein